MRHVLPVYGWRHVCTQRAATWRHVKTVGVSGAIASWCRSYPTCCVALVASCPVRRRTPRVDESFAQGRRGTVQTSCYSVGVAEYAMSVYVCVFVCLYASISRELHIQSSLMSRMMCNLYMTVGRFSSGGVAICSCFRFTDDVIIAQNASCMSRPFQRRVTIFALSCMG